jgi:hypothetical protein
MHVEADQHGRELGVHEDAGLLQHLPACGVHDRPIGRLQVAPRLQPAPEPRMKHEEHLPAVGRQHDGARRDVPRCVPVPAGEPAGIGEQGDESVPAFSGPGVPLGVERLDPGANLVDRDHGSPACETGVPRADGRDELPTSLNMGRLGPVYQVVRNHQVTNSACMLQSVITDVIILYIRHIM